MDGVALWLLGIVAFGSLVQTAFLIALLISGRRAARRLAEMEARLEREVRPSLDSLSRLTRNLAEISDRTTLQVRRIDRAVGDTLATLEDWTGAARRLLARQAGPLGGIGSLLRGVREGLDVYHRLKGLESNRRRPPRRARRPEDDEHLFI